MTNLKKKVSLIFALWAIIVGMFFVMSVSAAAATPNIAWETSWQKKQKTYTAIIGTKYMYDPLLVTNTIGIKSLKVADASIADVKLQKSGSGYHFIITGKRAGTTKVTFKAQYKKKKKTVSKKFTFKVKVINYLSPIATLTLDYGNGEVVNLLANGSNGVYNYKVPADKVNKEAKLTYTMTRVSGSQSWGRSEGIYSCGRVGKEDSSTDAMPLDGGKLVPYTSEEYDSLEELFRSEPDIRKMIGYTIETSAYTSPSLFGGEETYYNYSVKSNGKILVRPGNHIFFKYYLNPNRGQTELLVNFQ